MSIKNYITDVLEDLSYNNYKITDFNKTIKEAKEICNDTFNKIKQQYNTIYSLAKKLKYNITATGISSFKLIYKNSSILISKENINENGWDIMSYSPTSYFEIEEYQMDLSYIEKCMIYNIIIYDIMEKIPSKLKYARMPIPTWKLGNIWIDNDNVIIDSKKTHKQIFKSSFANPNLEQDIIKILTTYKDPKPVKPKVPKDWFNKLFENLKGTWENQEYKEHSLHDLIDTVKSAMDTMTKPKTN